MRATRNATIEPAKPPAAGDIRQRLETFDWASSPLGPRETWPQSLTLTLDLVLASGFPMALRWGPELIMIYNDAYAPLLGSRHPEVFGRPLREAWPEIWNELGPLNLSILRGERGSFFAENQRWRIERFGEPEEA